MYVLFLALNKCKFVFESCFAVFNKTFFTAYYSSLFFININIFRRNGNSGSTSCLSLQQYKDKKLHELKRVNS